MGSSDNKYFEAFKKDAGGRGAETEAELTEEEVLNSNNVELIAEYAKENRSKEAIDKVRELLELARKTGEEVVQNFLDSFRECEREKMGYLDFENTESGKLALTLLEKLPEPFKTIANKKLEDYKKELEYNTAIFRENKNNPEKIWKKVFGFDYYNIPDFKERFKTFLFKDVRAISKKYYNDNDLEARQDPFAINFFVENAGNFNEVYSENVKDANDKFGGFSKQQGTTAVNIINKNISSDGPGIDEIIQHESEHAIHRKANPIDAMILEPEGLYENGDFDINKSKLYTIKFDFEERLKKAKDEVFAYFKSGTEKDDVDHYLTEKGVDSLYDYNKENRELSYANIKNNQYLSEAEKESLNNAINFLQSEYDRVLKNMVNVIYGKSQSVEFFRNVPINELWKYSDGKYSRTDFIIRDFKF